MSVQGQRFGQLRHDRTDKLTGAMVRVLGCDPRRMHGSAPKLLLLDELAQWPQTKIAASLAASEDFPRQDPGFPCLLDRYEARDGGASFPKGSGWPGRRLRAGSRGD